MSHIQNDRCVDSLNEWLEDFGASPDDILTNLDGEKFIMVETDNGTAGEDGYDVYFKKVLLPREYQSLI